jgi:uridylate kinase
MLRNPLSSSRSKREYVVVSVGGSLIVPNEIDTEFLRKFHTLVKKEIGNGLSFFIITGGGKTARGYQDAAQTVRGDLPREDLDWLGIHSTRLNAHLLRTLFSEDAQDRIVKNPTRRVSGKDSIIIGAGWKPGWSTDYCAVLVAKQLGAKKMINLSNIDYVYDKDPRKNSDAQKSRILTGKTSVNLFRRSGTRDFLPRLILWPQKRLNLSA